MFSLLNGLLHPPMICCRYELRIAGLEDKLLAAEPPQPSTVPQEEGAAVGATASEPTIAGTMSVAETVARLQVRASRSASSPQTPSPITCCYFPRHFIWRAHSLAYSAYCRVVAPARIVCLKRAWCAASPSKPNETFLSLTLPRPQAQVLEQEEQLTMAEKIVDQRVKAEEGKERQLQEALATLGELESTKLENEAAALTEVKDMQEEIVSLRKEKSELIHAHGKALGQAIMDKAEGIVPTLQVRTPAAFALALFPPLSFLSLFSRALSCFGPACHLPLSARSRECTLRGAAQNCADASCPSGLVARSAQSKLQSLQTVAADLSEQLKRAPSHEVVREYQQQLQERDRDIDQLSAKLDHARKYHAPTLRHFDHLETKIIELERRL